MSTISNASKFIEACAESTNDLHVEYLMILPHELD